MVSRQKDGSTSLGTHAKMHRCLGGCGPGSTRHAAVRSSSGEHTSSVEVPGLVRPSGQVAHRVPNQRVANMVRTKAKENFPATGLIPVNALESDKLHQWFIGFRKPVAEPHGEAQKRDQKQWTSDTLAQGQHTDHS